jgi:MoxR-like ATPase
MTATSQLLEAFSSRILDAAFGVEPVVRQLVIATVARGHVLLQGVPGIGKTLLARAFTRALGGRFERVQGTADLLPADLTGVHVLNKERSSFVLHPGPLFGDVVLVDEINRSGPKTQSAMLQAMEERAIAIDRKVYPLAPDFMVIATQNPFEFEGTYALPESQLDRFLMLIDMSYPTLEAERTVLTTYDRPDSSYPDRLASMTALPAGLLAAARSEVATVHVAPAIYDYALAIAAATRSHAHISLGLSTRGLLALMRCARVEACLNGRDFVSPDDVKGLATVCVAHRLVLAPEASLEGMSAQGLLGDALAQVEVPRT